MTTAALAQQTVRAVHVAVVDSTGAAIGGAHVVVHRDPSLPPEQPDRSLDVDAAGKLSLPTVAGFYDVCVMSPAYAPTCRAVHVVDQDVDVRVALETATDVGSKPAAGR